MRSSTLEVDGSVEPANLNAPGQIVISGPAAPKQPALNAPIAGQKGSAAQCERAFHSRLMAGPQSKWQQP